MQHDDLRHLCVDLQCCGVRIACAPPGRTGGAGPAEGQTIIIAGRYLNVPAASWYVLHSPYRIEQQAGIFSLFRLNECIARVTFPPVPGFYAEISPAGLSYRQVALLHGSDCFASTVYQDCLYWNTPRQCLFCGIGLSLQNSQTVLVKDPGDLGRAAALAYERDAARHVTFTTGAWPDEAGGLQHLCACVQAIKEATPMPVHVQIHPPEALRAIDLLRAAGADTLGLHIEVCDDALRQSITPGKAAVGLPAYTDLWTYAVGVFGVNQVSSFLLAGLGETVEQAAAMAELLAGLGVFPYVLPLRPIPGTLLAGLRPPEPVHMTAVYARVASILKKNGLSSRVSRAGCVRCGACSCISLFEDEEAV